MQPGSANGPLIASIVNYVNERNFADAKMCVDLNKFATSVLRCVTGVHCAEFRLDGVIEVFCGDFAPSTVTSLTIYNNKHTLFLETHSSYGCMFD